MNIKAFRFRYLALLVAILSVLLAREYREHASGNKEYSRIFLSDASGYYIYLPAFFLENDLTLRYIDDLSARGERKHYHMFQTVETEAGEAYVCKYYVGVSLILLPFFLLSWLISAVAGVDLQGGYNAIFAAGMSAAAITYLILGLYYTYRLLRHYHSGRWPRLLLVLVLFLGTNLVNYTIRQPGMSHVYSFALIAYFLYQFKSYLQDYRASRIWGLAISLALIALVRPVNIMIVGALPLLAGSWRDTGQAIARLWQQWKTVLPAFLAMVAMVVVQLMIYKVQTGQFVVWSYQEEGFDFLAPKIWKSLVSYEKGLFVYMPLLLLATLGVIPLWKRQRFAALAFLGLFGGITYVTSSWWYWHYSGSLGLRPFVDFYALFAIPLMVLMTSIRLRPAKWVLGGILALVIGYNGLLHYQYVYAILPYYPINGEQYWMIFGKTNKSYGWIIRPPGTEPDERNVLRQQTVTASAAEPSCYAVKSERLGYGCQTKLSAATYLDSLRPTRLTVQFEGWLTELDPNPQIVAEVNIPGPTPTNLTWKAYRMISAIQVEETWRQGWMQFNLPPVPEKNAEVNVYLRNTTNDTVKLRSVSMTFAVLKDY